MTELRGALIGCGFFAVNQMYGWRDAGGASIVAICDRDPARLKIVGDQFGIERRYTDADAMLQAESLDFLDIATTVQTHRPLVELAASHKLPVICQKPFAPTLADAKAMVAACSSRASVMSLPPRSPCWLRKGPCSDAPPLDNARMACGVLGVVAVEDGAEHPHQRPVPIASVAKMMTAYVVLRHHPLRPGESGPRFVVGPGDVADTEARRRDGQSIVAVRAGEQLTEREALLAILLPSANNVAVLVARQVSGSVPAFVAEMNRTARAAWWWRR